jgi:hypothetical protein
VTVVFFERQSCQFFEQLSRNVVIKKVKSLLICTEQKQDQIAQERPHA